jgi:hypothetical protein
MISGETGAERLRRIVLAMDSTQESAFDGCNVSECILLVEACWASDWEVLPGDLPQELRDEARRLGVLARFDINDWVEACYGVTA